MVKLHSQSIDLTPIEEKCSALTKNSEQANHVRKSASIVSN